MKGPLVHRTRGPLAVYLFLQFLHIPAISK